MPNPKHRFSKSRTAKRRANFKSAAPTLSTCSNCGASVEYHHVCSECGSYRGKQAVEKETAI